MSISINPIQLAKMDSISFKSNADNKGVAEPTVAEEFVSKEASDAIVGMMKVNTPDFCQLYEVPPMPTVKELLKEIKEPILVDGEVIWDPENFEKLNVEVIAAKFAETPTIKGFVVEGAVNSEYANVGFTKWANDSYSLHFEKEAEAGSSAEYSMSFNTEGNIKYFSKTTELDVENDMPVYKIENVNYRRKTADIIYNDREIELGAIYRCDDAGKLVEVSKYINEVCDDFPYLGKEQYDGCIDDDTAVEKLLELRNR